MAKIRHVAMSVPDPQAAAKFYCDAFDMKIVGETDSPLASGLYVSDGTISLALLNYKADEWAGMNKDAVCINHIGFWVDDLDQQSDRIKENGGSFFRELPLDKESLYYEMKFRDPNGIIFDISHNGWVGAKK
ncbi:MULTISPECIES: VOC family protein [unclassified Beijerinckia]|uniref:VOC family protein n=1 Tax=unclassified Beijerinckia TaxID=2638183 RepID=UPI0008975B8B|nr:MULTISPECIES: VOC family protein [unclassified Beijerinckia]MDH7799238.1 methylmalonyl-CoA/ethylmalonyl-CoA epimerase [Beijerinckia sp. GAS462]SED91073.1 Catechol 2,3-dioxygenase [Beijerinckia sp. 28-YEA-48]